MSKSWLAALNADGIGWTWWTYREKTQSSGNFGVYYQDALGNPVLKPDWLALITSFFAVPGAVPPSAPHGLGLR